jgi:hypothetical protein
VLIAFNLLRFFSWKVVEAANLASAAVAGARRFVEKVEVGEAK